jgi:hypothetical protein
MDDNQVQVDSYKLFKTFDDHLNLVQCLLELKNSHLVSGSYDSTIKIYDLKSNLN